MRENEAQPLADCDCDYILYHGGGGGGSQQTITFNI